MTICRTSELVSVVNESDVLLIFLTKVTDIVTSNLPNVTSIERIYNRFEINYKINWVPPLTYTPKFKAKSQYNFTTQTDFNISQKRQ